MSYNKNISEYITSLEKAVSNIDTGEYAYVLKLAGDKVTAAYNEYSSKPNFVNFQDDRTWVNERKVNLEQAQEEARKVKEEIDKMKTECKRLYSEIDELYKKIWKLDEKLGRTLAKLNNIEVVYEGYSISDDNKEHLLKISKEISRIRNILLKFKEKLLSLS